MSKLISVCVFASALLLFASCGEAPETEGWGEEGEEDAIVLAVTERDRIELVLFDSRRDKALRSLSGQATLDLAQDGTKLNIEARSSDGSVKEFRFDLDNGSLKRTERHAPYVMAGHDDDDYHNWTPSIGQHTLLVKGYDASGKVVRQRTVEIDVIDSDTGDGDLSKPRVILDTDFGYDVDDVGALALLHALADKGEVHIVAVNSVVRDLSSPGAIDAINTYYGRPNLPIGQNKQGPKKWETAAPYWGSYGRYNTYLDQHYSNDETGTSVPSAVRNYRSVLSKQPDHSVTIAVVGFTQNMAELLRSKPDQHSSLTGKQLVAKKVKEVIIMGGPGHQHFNLTGGPDKDGTDTDYFLTHWPTLIKFQDGSVCGSVRTGSSLSKSNPVGKAYQLFLGGSGRKRPSWDQCTVLQAVRGNKHKGKTYFREIKGKTLRMNGLTAKSVSGSNVMVKRVISESEMTALIEDLMNNSPKNP